MFINFPKALFELIDPVRVALGRPLRAHVDITFATEHEANAVEMTKKWIDERS